MRLILLRHAPPLRTGLCYGQSDIAVQAVSASCLDDLRRRWKKSGSPPLWTSPARRCLDLARGISPETPVVVDPRLQEYHFGDWEGKPWADLPRDQIDFWSELWWERHPPGGESFAQFYARVNDVLREICSRGQSLWIVGHAGVFRILIGLIRQISPQQCVTLDIPYLTPLEFSLNAQQDNPHA